MKYKKSLCLIKVCLIFSQVHFEISKVLDYGQMAKDAFKQ